MNETVSALGSLNATAVLWAAGALAAMFVAVIIWDAIHQRRKHRRGTFSRSYAPAPGAGFMGIFFKPWRRRR